MDVVADLIDAVLTAKDEDTIARVKGSVRELTNRFPLYAAPATGVGAPAARAAASRV